MMAAIGPLNPLGEGAPPPPTLSFATVVSAGAATTTSSVGVVSTYCKEPALCMSRQDMESSAEPYRNALLGRFAFNRPPMEIVQKFFISLGLKGDCFVGLLEANHVLIRPTLKKTTLGSLYTELGSFKMPPWLCQSGHQISKLIRTSL